MASPVSMGFFVVAARDDVAAHGELALRGVGRQVFLGRRVYELAFDQVAAKLLQPCDAARLFEAHGVGDDFERGAKRRVHGSGRGLGHAPAGHHFGDAHVALQSLPDPQRRGRGGVFHGAQAQLALGQVGVVEQRHSDRRHALDARGAALLEELQKRPGIEQSLRNVGAADEQQGQKALHVNEHVVQGQWACDALALDEALAVGCAVGAAHEHVVRDHHALGTACGARGVADQHHLVRAARGFLTRAQRLVGNTIAQAQKRLPIERPAVARARRRLHDHAVQPWKRFGAPAARRA